MMDLNPNFENLSRPVILLLVIVAMSYAVVVNRGTSGAYWLSEVPLAAVLLITAFYWHLRKKIWFWAVVLAVAAIQAVLCILIPVPLITPSSPILLVLVSIDLLLMMACIKFVGRKIDDRK